MMSRWNPLLGHFFRQDIMGIDCIVIPAKGTKCIFIHPSRLLTTLKALTQ